MDSDRASISPLEREQPLITAVVLPGGRALDAAEMADALLSQGFDVHVRVLLFARSVDAARVHGVSDLLVITVPDALASDERALRRKAVSETTGDVYRFIVGARMAAGWSPPDLAGRLRQAGVPHPAEPRVKVGR